jgi:hypothetical protein
MVVEGPSTLKYESAVVVAEAHFVIVHRRNSGTGGHAARFSAPGRAREDVVTVLTRPNLTKCESAVPQRQEPRHAICDLHPSVRF